MVKFGKRVRRLMRKEWEEHYLEYKTLKKVLKSCKSSSNAEHVFLLALDQQLVRCSRLVPLSQMTEQFYDTRHLVNPIRIPVNGSTLFVPNAQLQQGLLRRAIDSPIRVALESAVDETVRIPLSLKGWLRMADEDQAALERTII